MRLVRCIFALLLTSCLFDWTVVPKAATCTSNGDCAETSYCKWADSECGAGEKLGTCTARPDGASCGKETAVCGCDTDPSITAGKCIFAAKGVDVKASCQ